MNFSDADIRKYIEIYLNNQSMGINFDALFELGHKDLQKKQWLLDTLHDEKKYEVFPVNVEEMINDYTMHLLVVFFILNSSNNMFSYVNKNFIDEYVKNESEIEGVNDLSMHGEEEMQGLEAMYRYINSGENEYSTGSLILTDLHEKLFSAAEGGAYARSYRTDTRFLPGSGVELEDPYMIVRSMRNADRMFDELYEFSGKLYNSEMEDRIHKINEFLDKLMKYKAELVRIHPFPDGNGRSIRGLINFLLERAGLPPVYVKAVEKEKYYEAMNKAIVDDDYRYLNGFYKNKLCDSIEELVINPFEAAIEVYKHEKEKYNKNKLDGNNVRRLLLQNDNLNKPKNNDKK